jgi:hypothetical protein
VTKQSRATSELTQSSNRAGSASLDNNIRIMDQLGENESPVVLVNVFTVDPSEADNVLAGGLGMLLS